jgi:hypothetical protein
MLAQSSSKASPQTYRGIEPKLFEHIVQFTAQPFSATRPEN